MTLDDTFTEFMSAHWPRLVRGARLLGADESTAEELAQAALVSCLVRWKRINRISDDPAADVFKSMLNEWSNRRRSNRVETAAYERLAGELVTQPNAALQTPAKVDLDQLSPEHRAIIVARYYLGLSEADTATALGINRGTAKSRHSRALERLRALPHDHETIEPEGQRAAGGDHARARDPRTT